MNLKELAIMNKVARVSEIQNTLNNVSASSAEMLLRNDVSKKINSIEEVSNNTSYEYGQGGWSLPSGFKTVMLRIYDSGKIPESSMESVDSIAEWLWSTTFKRLKVVWALSNMTKYETLDITKVGSCTDLGYQKGYYDNVMSAIVSMGYKCDSLIKKLQFDGYYSPSKLYHPYEEYEKCSYMKREEWEKEVKAHRAFTSHDAFVEEIAMVAEAL